MNKPLEDIIRDWAAGGDPPTSTPTKPSAQCLTFVEAEQTARGSLPGRPGLADHLRACPYCERLLGDFREALAEGPALDDQAAPWQRTRLVRHVTIALAASLLIAAGIGGFLIMRQQPKLLASGGVQVALASGVSSGVTAKGERAFTSGETILFRFELRHKGYLAIFNLDPHGRIVALPTQPPSQDLTCFAHEGVVTLGPYQLDETTGHETFFVVASDHRLSGIPSLASELQSAYDRAGKVEALTDLIRSQAAEVEVVAFEHIPRR